MSDATDEEEALGGTVKSTVLLPGCRSSRRIFHHRIGQWGTHPSPESTSSAEENDQGSEPVEKRWLIHRKWGTRDNRKGRHAIRIPRSSSSSVTTTSPRNRSLSGILLSLKRMLTQYPYWDVSYLVAVVFTFGSAIWVVNGFFSWLPDVRPDSSFRGEGEVGGGVTAMCGVLVFELGAVLLMFEAFNEERSYCFGWAVEEVLEEKKENLAGIETGMGTGLKVRLRPDRESCRHHHERRHHRGSSIDLRTSERPGRKWIWCPPWKDWKSHYLRDIGFLACLTEFVGASIYTISGITALPGLNPLLATHPSLIIILYWLPQILGSIGFVTSSLLFMLETQKKWWKPAPGVLGYWVGLWNLVGSMGFLLSGAFGIWTGSGGKYQAGCSTFWGSWAFLVGSLCQWFESLDKFPVEVERGARPR